MRPLLYALPLLTACIAGEKDPPDPGDDTSPPDDTGGEDTGDPAPDNQPPTASFSSPTDGEQLLAGSPLAVDLIVADPDSPDLRALALAWAGDAPPEAPLAPDADGHARFTVALEPGDRALSVVVTDGLGATGAAIVRFTVVEADVDGDGHLDQALGGDDCDDSDAAISPDAEERCDGVDNDCDALVDDADPDLTGAPTWYEDADRDGFGNPDAATDACAAPEGAVPDDRDCADADAERNPGAAEVCDGVDNDCDALIDDADPDVADPGTWYDDADEDGFGAPDAAYLACEAPAGAVEDSADCDDDDAAINPEAAEVCDGVDNDCDALIDDADPDVADPETWYEDADEDGFGDPSSPVTACTLPAGATADDTDCDDTDAAINPDAAEVCDEADNDCDGLTDDDDPSVTGTSTWYADADRDGFGDPADATLACDAPADAVADDQDCDDSDAAINPDAAEVCDEADNDCDGDTDEADAADASPWYSDADRDGFGDPADATLACEAPADAVADDQDCDDSDAAINPDAAEVCDETDNDCDGLTDDDDPSVTGTLTWYADADSDGFGDLASPGGACDAPAGSTADNTDCDDSDAAINPDAAEVCDRRDNDCDGDADESDAVDASTWYADADSDGFGDPADATLACDAPADAVADDQDCDDSDAAINPDAAEVCDEADNDCDGLIDDDDPGVTGTSTWYTDADGDGHGVGAASWSACAQPSGTADSDDDCDDSEPLAYPGAAERCGDGVDEDCDGSDPVCTMDWVGELTLDDSSVYDAAIYGTASSSEVGAGRSFDAGDFDGDGQLDLVVGAYGRDTAYVQATPLASGAYEVDDYDVATLSGSSSSWAFAYRVASIEDWDGDGYDELALVKTGTASPPLYVYEGPFSGSYTTSSGYAAAPSTSYCTNSMAVTGVGAFQSTASSGQLACTYDPSSGANRIEIFDAASSTPAGYLAGENSADQTGEAMVGGRGRDADGDGLDDLWIGARGVTAATGAAYVVLAGTMTSSYLHLSDADAKILGGNRGDTFGSPLDAGDVDGDGYADLVADAPLATPTYYQEGEVYVFFDTLSATSVSTADVMVYGSSGEEVGNAVSVGDINADGAGDLLICDGDNNDGGLTRQGAAWLIYGPLSGTYDLEKGDYDARFVGSSTSDYVGSGCRLDHDLDGDGMKDLLIGGETVDHGSTAQTGGLFVLVGG